MKYQVAIIGGGPAGYTAAEAAGKAGLSVVLFEKQSLGGVCLNEGCIPTKTLLYSAKTYDAARHASKYAVTVSEASFDLSKIIARKQKVVRKLVLGVKGKLTAHGVNIVQGEATIINKNTVQCSGETYECENLILCTGSETFIPPIPGVDTVPFWTHRDALDNKELPASLAIIGGGVIGIEFASFFNSLGVQVTVIEMLDEILGGMDKELSALLRAEYAKRGIKFMLSTKVVSLAEASSEDGKPQVQVNFENAEGNLGIANAILEHLAVKLPVSRLQRDLTDSTVLRNVGTPFGHIVIAIQSSLKGLRKLLLNETAIYRDLDNCWSVVAEAIQTILRREAYPHPYEALKALTRTNQAITETSIKEFIEGLDVNEEIKKELRVITPHSYTGI